MQRPRSAGARLGRRPLGLQAGDELLEAQLLEPLTDRLEFAGAVLDQVAALLDEVERLAQAGVARVQATDDLLDPGHGLLVSGLFVHRSSFTRAPSTPSWKRRRRSRASRAAAAEPSGSPRGSCTSA